MTGKELWDKFIAETNLKNCEYEAWSFGVDADLLAHFVKIGVKTATSSAYPLYEAEDEPLPSVGAYSVILDAQENAVCVIRTKKVEVVPFHAVTAEHAYREGEGDKSLAYWRKVHEEFFAKWMGEAGLTFTSNMMVVCEEFEVVYKP